MLYREIIAVCSQIHTKHINKLCGQNVELLSVKLAVHIVALKGNLTRKRKHVCLNPQDKELGHVSNDDTMKWCMRQGGCSFGAGL
jgi:hypothetical protein